VIKSDLAIEQRLELFLQVCVGCCTPTDAASFIKSEDRRLHSFYPGKGLLAQIHIDAKIACAVLELPNVLF